MSSSSVSLRSASIALYVFRQLEDDAMKPTVTAGLAVLAGVALFEAALIPGVVIGGAAVLAPKFLPGLRRRLKPLFGSTIHRPPKPAAPSPGRRDVQVPAAAPGGFAIKRAIAKTITFRIIVTTLDFTTNYIVIGELATAAGLSAFALVAGPVFYLAHEIAWNRYGASSEAAVAVRLPLLSSENRIAGDRGELAISRALAKTITFRTIATAMDFTANYVVVGDLATAVGLSAFAFVVGPFVYLGHEKLWDYYGSPRERTFDPPAPPRLLPAPA
jgi:uncharacterized membrane protein